MIYYYIIYIHFVGAIIHCVDFVRQKSVTKPVNHWHIKLVNIKLKRTIGNAPPTQLFSQWSECSHNFFFFCWWKPGVWCSVVFKREIPLYYAGTMPKKTSQSQLIAPYNYGIVAWYIVKKKKPAGYYVIIYPMVATYL